MKIKTLVVDDSLFMRTLVSDVLNSDPDIEVIGTAKDGPEAIKKILKMKPDVITLDLVMPGWDGLTTLKHVMTECPTPVVILSAHSKKDADVTLKCLNAGAVSFVLKPSGELSLDIEDVKDQLLEEVKAASRVNVGKIKSLIAKKPERKKRRLVDVSKIIAIGASTGGPQTLEVILSSLPADFPAPIIVIQHMPTRFFTQSLAERLDDNCELTVKVAENNEIIRAGKVYLAPGGFRMTVKSGGMRNERGFMEATICLSEDEPSGLGPSVDVTMKSVADLYDGNAIGIILTGMGRDGREGMKAIKKSGGRTIVQDESSLIFGMPRVIIDGGYADEVLPPSEMSSAVLDMVEGKGKKVCKYER